MEQLKSRLVSTNLSVPQPADSDIDSEISHHDMPPVPALFSTYPPIQDELVTESSRIQDNTVEEVLPHLLNSELELNSYGVPALRRKQHIWYLKHSLTNRYPAPFVAIDASRPWFLYWSLTGLYTLGEDITKYADRYV
jgi:protein farnesyltransferase subunit beta